MVSTRRTTFPTPPPQPSRASRKHNLLEEAPELFAGDGSLPNEWQVPPSEFISPLTPPRLPLPDLVCSRRQSISFSYSQGSINGISHGTREVDVEGEQSSDESISQHLFEFEDALSGSGILGLQTELESVGTRGLERSQLAITSDVEERILAISSDSVARSALEVQLGRRLSARLLQTLLSLNR
ncbi:hypothetical protein L218DRAFT_1009157 [Marasmius fiardii PR-910]|nr:hypothetical protein L218DRAFT_1009157 [Marasmius fiardii PR-910]